MFLLGASGLAVHATTNADENINSNEISPDNNKTKKVIIERDMGTFIMTPELPCVVDIDITKAMQVEKYLRECVNVERLWIKAI